MAILFAGNEPECFTYTGTVVWSTTVSSPARFQSTHQRGAHIADNLSYLNVPNFGAQTDVWLRFFMGAAAGNSDGNQGIVRFYDNAGSERFRLERASGGGGSTIQARYWNGSAFTNIGGATATYTGFYGYVDVHLSVNSGSGSFELYQNGSLVDSGSADFSSISDIASISFGRGSGSGTTINRMNVSEVIVSTQSTIGHMLFTREPTGNGAQTDWTGDYTDINEAAVNDADFINAGADQDVSTFTSAGMSTYLSTSGLEIKAVALSIRARNDGSPPGELQGVVRIGGTDYPSASVPSLGVGFGFRQPMWTVDPSTSLKWDPEDVESSSFEFGVKAVA